VSAIALLLALSLGGCVGVADIVRELGKDPASNCIRVTSIYATILLSRSNISGGSVSCTSDGMTIKSDPPVTPSGLVTVPVPVQVVPQTLSPVRP
jgi:hypothetical protein